MVDLRQLAVLLTFMHFLLMSTACGFLVHLSMRVDGKMSDMHAWQLHVRQLQLRYAVGMAADRNALTCLPFQKVYYMPKQETVDCQFALALTVVRWVGTHLGVTKSETVRPYFRSAESTDLPPTTMVKQGRRPCCQTYKRLCLLDSTV